MVSANIPVNDIQGLTPAIDPRKIAGVAALAGKNFLFDADGVRSFRGSTLLYPFPLGDPKHIQYHTIRIEERDRTFIMTDSAILEWNPGSGVFEFLFMFEELAQAPHTWTLGFLNGFLFFCHPEIGIVNFNTRTGAARMHSAPGLPEAPIAIAVNNGRLVVIDAFAFYWSAQSNGFDFTPAIAGAGFQVINDRVPGVPLMVSSFSRGVFVWTSGGVMFSEFTGDIAVYRHRALNTEYRPLNSFSFAKLEDETVIVLDRRGLFVTNGGLPEPFDPLFNEHLIGLFARQLARQRDLTRLTYDFSQRHLYVQLPENETSSVFSSAFVLYVPVQKWGRFNRRHYALGVFQFDGKEVLSWVGEDGLHFQNFNAAHEEVPSTGRESLVWNFPKEPTEIAFTHRTLGDIMRVSDSDENGRVGPSGYYLGTARAQLPLSPLDSYVVLGPIRLTDGTISDQTTEMQRINIGSLVSADGTVPVEDFLLVPDGVSDEDFQSASGAEDFGFNPVASVDFDLRVIGTLDGLREFAGDTPQIAAFSMGQRYYSTSVVGIWHLVELTTPDIGQIFQLRWLELEAIIAGRLN